jgi:hypothetical protein
VDKVKINGIERGYLMVDDILKNPAHWASGYQIGVIE